MARKQHQPTTWPGIDTALPVFRTCKVCHALVCQRLWHHRHGDDAPWWQDLGEPLSPIFGVAHRCGADGADC